MTDLKKIEAAIESMDMLVDSLTGYQFEKIIDAQAHPDFIKKIVDITADIRREKLELQKIWISKSKQNSESMTVKEWLEQESIKYGMEVLIDRYKISFLYKGQELRVDEFLVSYFKSSSILISEISNWNIERFHYYVSQFKQSVDQEDTTS